MIPFGLKNAHLEFQNIMNNIFNPCTSFSIVCIDDFFFIFSNFIDQHFKHLQNFQKIVKDRLVIFAPKIKLFQISIRFLGFEIYQGIVKPIQRVVKFTSKFSNEIKDRNQLQRFLRGLNYVSDFYPILRTIIKPLFHRLRQNPKPWTQEYTKIVKTVKQQVKTLLSLRILNPNVFPIIEIDASNLGYGGILK